MREGLYSSGFAPRTCPAKHRGTDANRSRAASARTQHNPAGTVLCNRVVLPRDCGIHDGRRRISTHLELYGININININLVQLRYQQTQHGTALLLPSGVPLFVTRDAPPCATRKHAAQSSRCLPTIDTSTSQARGVPFGRGAKQLHIASGKRQKKKKEQNCPLHR